MLETCQHPGVLRALYFVYLLLDVIFIVVPIGLIIMLLIDFSKAVIAGEDDKAKKSTKIVVKRIIYAVLIFAMPWIVNLFLEFLSYAGFSTDYLDCRENAMSGNFAYYDKLYEEEQSKIEEERKRRIEERKEKLKSEQKELEKIIQDTSLKNGTSYMKGSSPINNYESGVGGTIDKEPNPLNALTKMYNSTGSNMYNPNNFSVMKDKNTGLSLGSWPKEANVSNLSGNVTTYANGNLIFPTTGNGYASYNHNGIDIVGNVGEPIYFPVDGTLRFSEWGHTSNKGTNETAYSALIVMDKPFSYNGQWAKGDSIVTKKAEVGTIFLTHMVGIKNRCNSSNSIHVNKGDLIGFMGVANNTPHLHMTLYMNDQSYGLYSPEIKKIYGLNESKIKKAGQ